MLKRKYRLTKNGSFSYIYAHGTRVSEKKIRLNYVSAGSGVHVGFSVSNKIGKAVVRNKLKRRMRAVMEGYCPRLRPCQAVFVAAPGAAELCYGEIEAQMTSCLVRAGLIGERK